MKNLLLFFISCNLLLNQSFAVTSQLSQQEVVRVSVAATSITSNIKRLKEQDLSKLPDNIRGHIDYFLSLDKSPSVSNEIIERYKLAKHDYIVFISELDKQGMTPKDRVIIQGISQRIIQIDKSVSHIYSFTDKNNINMLYDMLVMVAYLLKK